MFGRRTSLYILILSLMLNLPPRLGSGRQFDGGCRTVAGTVKDQSGVRDPRRYRDPPQSGDRLGSRGLHRRFGQLHLYQHTL